MEKIIKGNPDEDGHYWLNQINAPKYVLDLVVLNSLNLTKEQQTRRLNVGGKQHEVVAIPLIAIGFKGEEKVHEAILSAMGYGNEDLPAVAA